MSLATQYESRKARSATHQRRQSESGRDIGAIPPVADPGRRRAAAGSFRAHCETYFGATFRLKWSDDHLKVIDQVETAVLRGELFATAMPRGSGKTSLAEAACNWAALNGYHPFICLIGSDEGAAESILESIKVELEVNDDLAADYPEVCGPIVALEGIANRCKGQSYRGERTRVEWSSKVVVLPTIRPAGWDALDDHADFLRPDGHSLASGAIIRVAGLTGGIRGMRHKRADGVTVRPSFVIPDDPQTDASARSPSQCATRERILAGAVLGLAGPGSKIAGVMPCTVIRPGDVADNILDRDKHPEWHGTRTKLVYSFPTNEKLWEQYAQIRAESLKCERGGAEATEFYRQNREEMDAGSRVAWPERKNPDEISAIQHAMNLRFDRGERAFCAEYQNEPLPEEETRADDLTADEVAGKVNRMARGAVPLKCSRVTSFIDVQGNLLYWMACGWEDDFGGYILDYGTFPDQNRPYFTSRDAKQTLAEAFPKAGGLEGRLYAGLEALAGRLLGHEWTRDDGAGLKIERLLIDANWGESTEVVYQFIRQSPFSGLITPSHGKYVGAASKPFREYEPRPGDRAGFNWRLPNVQGRRSVRHVIFDTNFWKSFVHARLSTAMGDRGCLSLFGDRPETHRLLADHLTAEYRVRTEGRGREVDEWRLRPERPDNHYFDCLVGCAVAASMQGVALAETAAVPAKRREKVSFAELRERRAQSRA